MDPDPMQYVEEQDAAEKSKSKRSAKSAIAGKIIKTMDATVARTVISSFFLPRIL